MDMQAGIANSGFEMNDLNDCEDSQIAIRVENAGKRFREKIVIVNLNMTVPEGSIYALLGASGCGKTTILNAILGQTKLDRGSVEIFGYPTGSVESGIPGSRVGLMPQELSLFEEFTIKEILFYFGRIYAMSKEKIQEKTDFLVRLLKIPLNTDTQIRNLSGGQKRRISFAISLIHDAQILILDEPTVGVDPILRKCIWEYLCDLALNQKTTIVITTHYIEEAESANIIGIMRNGRILVEDSPRNLLNQYELSFSEIVLRISQNDEENCENQPEIIAIQTPKKRGAKKISWVDRKSKFLPKMQAQLFKSFIRVWRNILFLIGFSLMPAMTVIFCCTVVGKNMTHVKFGFVSLEEPTNCQKNLQPFCSNTNTTAKTSISCHLPSYFPKDSIDLTYYSNELKALEDVNNWKIMGYIVVPENFTKNYPNSLKDIRIHIDLINKIVVKGILPYIKDGIKLFSQAYAKNCTVPKDTINITTTLDDNHPVKIEFNGVFGDLDIPFTDVTGPSFHLVSLMAGVRKGEILLAHFCCQFVIMFLMVSANLVVLFLIFDLTCMGSIFAVIFISILQGIMGILMGFLISIICSDEAQVLQLSMPISMLFGFLAGGMWPLDGMVKIMKIIIECLPSTLSFNSIRAIISKGNGIFDSNVWPGFATSSGWILILIFTLFILNKFTH